MALASYKTIENLRKRKKETTTNILTALFKLTDYMLDLKKQQGKKMFIINALPRLNIGTKDISNMMARNLLQHINTTHV